MTGCICARETALCVCGHPVRQHVIAGGQLAGTTRGAFACPVHGRMSQCQVCECGEFSHQVTRAEIDTLTASARDGGKPRWGRNPGTAAEFFAALLLRTPGAEPVYDHDGTLTSIRGLRLKGGD